MDYITYPATWKLYLVVRQCSQGTEQCHSLPGARGPTQHKRFVLSKPGVEEQLVSNSVQGGDDNVRRAHFVGLHLNLGDLVCPLCPLPLDCDLRENVRWKIYNLRGIVMKPLASY